MQRGFKRVEKWVIHNYERPSSAYSPATLHATMQSHSSAWCSRYSRQKQSISSVGLCRCCGEGARKAARSESAILTCQELGVRLVAQALKGCLRVRFGMSGAIPEFHMGQKRPALSSIFHHRLVREATYGLALAARLDHSTICACRIAGGRRLG